MTKEERERRYKLYSNRRLRNIIAKRITTTMIAAVVEFEKVFDHLWGNEENRTPEQQRYYDLWMATRTRILDRGNDQRKAATGEINNYDVKWNKYHLEIKQREDYYE